MNDIDEQNQRFIFDERWQVWKYDDSPDFRKQLMPQIQGSKAVDIVAIGPPNDDVYLIEIKDYRKDYKLRPAAEVVDAICAKVRDSFPGLIGTMRRGSGPEFLKTWLGQCCFSENPIKVVLWDEEQEADVDVKKARATILRKEIRRKLRWLNASVIIVGQCYESTLPGLSVKNLPGAGLL